LGGEKSGGADPVAEWGSNPSATAGSRGSLR
jgi:hypothetical protein